jgi:beta-glucanase (GH16 family)
MRDTGTSRPRRGRVLIAAAAVSTVVAGMLAVTMNANASLPSTPSGWSLVWADDFTGAANTLPSSSNWIIDTGTQYPGGPANWGTGEIQTYTNSTSNLRQDGNGNLVITPIRSGSGQWTSARIETQRSNFKPPSGGELRIEGRIQMPNITGNAALGYWPAFWALGAPYRGNYQNWPGIGEIDIMEDINGRSSVFGTLHCGTTMPPNPCNEFSGLGSGEKPCVGCQTDFHIYRVEWDESVSPEEIRWYLDGNNYFTVRSDQVDATTWKNATDHGYFLILNVAMGGGFPGAFGGGPTDATVPGIPMIVEYVRVFTREAQP